MACTVYSTRHKIPGNPPAVGNPDTLSYRQSLYITYLGISGFSALGIAIVHQKLRRMQIKKVAIPAAYATIMISTYFAMPVNPDEITVPMDLVIGFRLASGFTMSVFWGLLGIIFGAFWDKLKPHETAKLTI